MLDLNALKLRLDKIAVCEPNTGCFLSTLYADKDGYTAITVNKRTMKTHRVSWLVNKGEIPTDLLVLHKCDTPACINPEHLFLGTQKDNCVDKSSKHRHHNQRKTHCKCGQSLDVRRRRCVACTRKNAMLNYYTRKELREKDPTIRLKKGRPKTSEENENSRDVGFAREIIQPVV